MKLMIPFTPHLALECLEQLNCKTENDWPEIDKQNIAEEIKMAVQIDGKTRDILTIKKDLNQKDIIELVNSSSKAKKYLNEKKVFKTIFVKNKIINYIIEKKMKNFILLVIFTLVIGCGFKVVNKSQLMNFNLKEINTSGENRINYKLKNKLLIF